MTMDTLLCRVCLNSNALEYVELEAKFSNKKITYLECFNACTQLSVKSGDELPNMLCLKCANRLEDAYLFVLEAREAEKRLRNRNNASHSIHKAVEIITAKNGSFKDADIENMEIVVLKPLEAETVEESSTLLEERTHGDHSSYVFNNYALRKEEQTDLVLEISEEKKGKPWKCRECRKSFDSSESYQEHMDWHKKLNYFKCADCSKHFRTQKSLERHSKLRHKVRNEDEVGQIEKICDLSCDFITLLSCNHCNKVFSSDEMLHKHEQIQHSSMMTKPAKTSVEIDSHESTQHEACLEEIIEETFYEDFAESIIEQCRAENSGDDESIKPENRDRLSSMLKECPVCKKRLLERNLEKHLKLHTTSEGQQQDFLCSYCPRRFKSQKTFRQHEKTHFDETFYVCVDCDRQYSTLSLLDQHRRNTHKEKEHACGICGNAFKLRNQLTNHMKLHLEKNIQCPHCEKKYARQFDLNVHLRSHTGELPYQCHLCEKRFAIKVRLTYHLQKHYGIKHSCKECGKEFNSKQKLKGHSFKHTGFPYRCELCDHGFPNRDVFKRHLLRVHQATISEEALLEMFQRYTGKTTRIREIQVSVDADVPMEGESLTPSCKIDQPNNCAQKVISNKKANEK